VARRQFIVWEELMMDARDGLRDIVLVFGINGEEEALYICLDEEKIRQDVLQS
jgi:hypothetical protein